MAGAKGVPQGARKIAPDAYVKLYEASKAGMTVKRAASLLGVREQTLMQWMKTEPAVAASWAAGRSKALVPSKSSARGQTWAEYVFGRLPAKLQRVWANLTQLETEENTEGRIQMILNAQGKRARQSLWLHALFASNFAKTEACRKVNVNMITVQTWAKTDPGFGQLLDAMLELKKDFAEGCLLNLVAQGDTGATIFVAKTLCRDRGYDPKLTVEHTGIVRHAHLDVEKLLDRLSPKGKRELLRAMDEESDVKALPAHEDVIDAEYEELP